LSNKHPRQPGRLLAVLVFLPLLIGLIGWLLLRERRIERPAALEITTAGQVEMCLSCHREERLDGAHDQKVIGCSPCHLGNPLSIDKAEAHQDMVLNPGDLRVAHRTCGVEGCHPADIHKVKNSLMATNRGIIATLLYYWGEAPDQNGEYSVEQLLATGKTSLALDYYRKLCATCHLWKQKNDLPGASAFFNEKGGGCSACHYVLPAGAKRETVTDFAEGPAGTDVTTVKKKPHPLVVKKVPEDNCIRCHNRSGRIGISYTGVFEAEGYGTPLEQGQPSSQRLPGERFYLKVGEDIHHARGLACIDCHTRDEIMGDGTSYAHYEEQLEIRCESCHSPRPGTTAKGKGLPQVREENGAFVMQGKLDDKLHPLKPPKQESCRAPFHQRLSCESCHSAWVPQCYGCHVKRDMNETHLDKLSLKETPGWWEEGRSYIRYERPMLAMWGEEVVVVTPGCQDIVTLLNKDGTMDKAFNRLTMAAINPHTTSARGRDCVDCHTSPKTLGLGEGTLTRTEDKWQFQPLHRGEDTAAGVTGALDGYVTIEGTPLQHGSRPDLRPFNGEELGRILRVGLCLACHTTAADPLYRHWPPAAPCPAATEP